jgi:hypothetical protein
MSMGSGGCGRTPKGGIGDFVDGDWDACDLKSRGALQPLRQSATVNRALLLAALLSLAAGSAPQAHAAASTLASAKALVRAQYAAGAETSPALYAPDIAKILADPAQVAPSDLGIDPRFGQDDWKISGLKVSAAHGPNGEARVTARFLDFGKPARIEWRLIPATDGPGGWKVLDISGPRQNDWRAFDMRDLLNLPPAP